MSTKTTFKRIALVAVAALGLGVLSVAPSSANPSGLTVTTTNGTATTLNSDSTTGATIKVSFLALQGAADSVTVAIAAAAALPTGASVTEQFMFSESTTSVSSTPVTVDTTTINAAPVANKKAVPGAVYPASRGAHIIAGSTSNGTYSATLKVTLGETTTSTLVVGTYSYNAIVTSQSEAPGSIAVTTVVPFSITVTNGVSTAVDPSKTTAFIGASSGPTADAVIAAVATNDTTVDGYIQLNIYNAASSSTVAVDSVTATVTGAGLISFDGTTYGKSIKVASTGSQSIRILGDGTAGVSTISISTASGFSTVKTMTFYAKEAKTITAAVATPVLTVGANGSAVSVSAVDAKGTNWTGTAYIVASSAADALVGGSATTPVQCSAWNADDGILCPITTIANGTAKFKVIDASTVAAATATSNEVTVTVSNAAPASIKLSFDKATYAPFEKATITLTPLDKDGKAVAAQSAAALVTTAGITSNYAFSTGSDTTTAAGGITTSALTGVKKYTVYMPGTGDITITATGGSALPVAGQVAVTATASVVNSSVDAATDAANEATDAANAATDAALAAADAADAATAAAQDASDAVAALSASVSKMITALKAQITSLTNLVIKIQKKVKA